MTRSTKRTRARALPRPAAAAADVQARLARDGQRLTPQRTAVLGYLRGARHHPTAEDVYVAVRGELPQVSLATIYNSLEMLVRRGLASKLTSGDGAARYDIRTDLHSHLRCLRCDRVEDLDAVPDRRWLRSISTRGFRATGFRFELVGYCRTCQQAP
jgi:Fe2+ or Zn2+ uptake regulation protein